MDNEEKIKTLRQDWALALMTKGVIAKITVSRWRGTSQLTPQDLGITFHNNEAYSIMKKYIVLGYEKLLPIQATRELDIIERRAKENLLLYSFNTVWGKFIPFSAFEEWAKENELIKQEYQTAAMEMVNNYDSIVSIVKENYKKLGEEAWRRIYPKDTGTPSLAFLEDFSNKIASKIPPKENILASFRYECTFLSIPLPSFLQEDLLKREKVSNALRLEKIEFEAKTKIIAQYQRQKDEMIEDFLEATVKGMRGKISEFCEEALIGMMRCKTPDISKVTSDKIRKFIDYIRSINFQNDSEIENMLDELNRELEKFKGERSKDNIIKNLQDIVDLAKKEFTPEINSFSECFEP